MKNYKNEFCIKNSLENTYQAILNDVDKWWTSTANKTEKVGDELLATFNKEGTLFMKMKISKLVPNKLIYWEVLDDNLDLHGRIPKGEWIGTTIQWELETQGEDTVLHFEHKGLTPELVCYDVCENGWNHFLDSFVQYLNTGKGNPDIIH